MVRFRIKCVGKESQLAAQALRETVLDQEHSQGGSTWSDIVRRSSAAKSNLKPGEEIGPLYDQEIRFYAVESGKVRLYNLLPTGARSRFPSWAKTTCSSSGGRIGASLSCICAEAMQPSRVIGVSEKDLVDLAGVSARGGGRRDHEFRAALTESQVLIEDLMNNSVNFRLYRTLLELAREFGRNRERAELGRYRRAARRTSGSPT